EAMAMGLPVLSTFHGGIPELVQDGVSGYLVPERDSEALAARLKDLLDHPERWEAMGQAGRAYVEAHYNIETLNDRLVQVYEHLMEADSGGMSLGRERWSQVPLQTSETPSDLTASVPVQVLGE
ncbi:MAG TPA: glycosyltransferase, partial [Trichocoleus sp.]